MSEPYRVVVVEDDPDVAFYIKTILTKQGCIVQTFTDPAYAQQAMRLYEPDVVITDIEMPGITGIQVIELVREVRPGTPVIVMTAHVSVDYAVEALRANANEFLTKPISSSQLIAVVTRLADEFRAARSNIPDPEVVLAIGAHPDDVEIGVGGILLTHRAAGDEVHILTLSRGGRSGHVNERQSEAFLAAEMLGARLHLEDLPESEVAENEPTLGIIERIVAEVRPTVVYVHSQHDVHQDHRAVHKAALLAAQSVRSVSCYQSTSATVDFRPNRFVNIDGWLEQKVQLVQAHRSQVAVSRFHSAEFLESTARYWARFGEGTACEPLEIVRDSGDLATGSGEASQALRAARENTARQLAQ